LQNNPLRGRNINITDIVIISSFWQRSCDSDSDERSYPFL